ncbi:MAG: flavodoxin family protein [Coprothermobacterota bacterium]|nr:flavodoxin family protein [Coprothermobacterota bacterium]
MKKAVVINGSPQAERGTTGRVLAPFIEGMEAAGAEAQLFYAGRMKIKPCSGELDCWNKKPGQCIHADEMEALYPMLRRAETLVLATPVYIPLPGEMQNFLNRLCPLLEPVLETRDGRTRARFRADVAITRIVLVVTSGWWEAGNCDTVVRIAQEIAADAGVEFAGALVRPHAHMIWKKGEPTKEGQVVLEALRKAGQELIASGSIDPETLIAVSRPLCGQEEYRQVSNRSYRQASGEAEG